MSDQKKIAYYSGLDLGCAQDFTALAVLERTLVPDPDGTDGQVGHYAVRHLERFALGTPYPEIAARLAALYAEAPLARSLLAVDETGVGRPVVRMLQRGKIRANIRPVVVSAGHRAVAEGGGWLVPKKELVGVLQLLLQSRRLTVSSALAEAPTLVRELQTFRAKVSTAADGSLEDWRERPHDDLVLAVAVAAWFGERFGRARFWLWC